MSVNNTNKFNNIAGGDNRGVSGQSFKLARFSTVSVNGGEPVTLRQRSGSSGIILSQPLNVTFNEGGGNSITIAGLNGSKSSDYRILSWLIKY